jgi:hypothetical protein
MTELTDAITVVNSLSPLGLAAMLAYIIYQLVNKRGTVRAISENHLSGLPDIQALLTALSSHVQALHASSQRIETAVARLEGLLSK